MPAIPDITLRRAATITPANSIMEAARLMSELNVGALSVCDGDAVVGMVTDRDITLRATAQGRAPRSMAVAEVMHWCSEGDPADAPSQHAGSSSEEHAGRGVAAMSAAPASVPA